MTPGAPNIADLPPQLARRLAEKAPLHRIGGKSRTIQQSGSGVCCGLTTSKGQSMTHAPDPDPDPDFAQILTLLHRRARRLRSCPHEAADLAQDTALRLLQHCRTGAQIRDPRAYALGALHNMARSQWRSRRSWVELQDDMATTLPDAPRRIACAQLCDAIADLPPEQARLIALVAAGETSPARLARITGQPPGTVMSRLARARATMRRRMGMGKSTPTCTLY